MLSNFKSMYEKIHEKVRNCICLYPLAPTCYGCERVGTVAEILYVPLKLPIQSFVSWVKMCFC